jgi:hypothetical protein
LLSLERERERQSARALSRSLPPSLLSRSLPPSFSRSLSLSSLSSCLSEAGLRAARVCTAGPASSPHGIRTESQRHIAYMYTYAGTVSLSRSCSLCVCVCVCVGMHTACMYAYAGTVRHIACMYTYPGTVRRVRCAGPQDMVTLALSHPARWPSVGYGGPASSPHGVRTDPGRHHTSVTIPASTTYQRQQHTSVNNIPASTTYVIPASPYPYPRDGVSGRPAVCIHIHWALWKRRL